MQRLLEYHIDETGDGMRIGDFLRDIGYSRHILTHLKRTERGILLNGVWAYTNQILKKGDVLLVSIIENEGSDQILPVPMDLKIVYEDEDLLVIDKPADMPVHPSINNHENTLANGVLYYFSSQGIPYTYRCLNRLDRDTSGLLILAKHMVSASLLSAMAVKREIHREYLAVVDGILPESGTIDAPIARVCNSAIMRQVDYENGERAITHYKRIFCDGSISAALVCLETGRTHQIRVHMKHIGYPLLGDFLYYPEYLERPDCRIRRQALHSCRLAFVHPITQEQLDFRADVPEDMKVLLPVISCFLPCYKNFC